MRTLLLMIIGMISLIAKSATITVDNNVPSMGDYTTLQAAHNAASAGDIIMVFPSNVHYQAITVQKPLTIIGAGSEQVNNTLITYLTGTMVFDPGSEGSSLSSFCGPGNSLFITINTNEIILKRLKVRNVLINENCIGIIVNGCKIYSENNETAINIQAGSEVLINNNSINLGHYANGIIVTNSTVIICFNVFQLSYANYGTILISNSNCDIFNNYFPNSSYTNLDPCPYQFNIVPYSGIICGSTNIYCSETQQIFVNYLGGDFHLVPGSPAIGAGLNGEDIGIYGGDMPYVDGGFPSLPVIYQLDVPLTGTQEEGLNIIIKAKTVY